MKTGSRVFLLSLMALLNIGCSTLPSLYQAAEEVADDTAIRIECSKEAITKDTNIDIALKVTNNS